MKQLPINLLFYFIKLLYVLLKTQFMKKELFCLSHFRSLFPHMFGKNSVLVDEMERGLIYQVNMFRGSVNLNFQSTVFLPCKVSLRSSGCEHQTEKTLKCRKFNVDVIIVMIDIVLICCNLKQWVKLGLNFMKCNSAFLVIK
jgi:hypothetical protein